MVKFNDTLLEERIRDFLGRYRKDFEQLMTALDAAEISHYSPGGGTKSIAFDIFPASGYVREMQRMLSLDRAFKPKIMMGLQDAEKGVHNPAGSFLLFLRRWAGFAEQVMRREGDAPRGVAAARAKLLIDHLAARLGEGNPASGKPTEFSRLMDAISRALQKRGSSQDDHHALSARTLHEHNYSKALASAQNGVTVKAMPRLTAAASSNC